MAQCGHTVLGKLQRLMLNALLWSEDADSILEGIHWYLLCLDDIEDAERYKKLEAVIYLYP